AFSAVNGTSVKARRPRLRVTNWWTGAYDVEDDGLSAPATEYTFGNVARENVERRGDARRKAHEQVAAARARAEAMRRRVRDHRHARLRHPAERQPGIFIGILSVLFLGGILTAAFVIGSIRDGVSDSSAEAISRESLQNGLRVFAIIDSERADDEAVLAEAVRHISNQRRRDLDVRLAAPAQASELLPLIQDWKDRRTREHD